jgi:hypothetical protein
MKTMVTWCNMFCSITIYFNNHIWWAFMIFSFACHDLPLSLGFPLGDPCWSQDAAADHEGCEARSADGTSSSLDDRWKNHAPWIALRIAGSETNDLWSRSPESDVRYFKMSATKVEIDIDSEGWPVWSMFKLRTILGIFQQHLATTSHK